MKYAVANTRQPWLGVSLRGAAGAAITG